MIRDNGLSSARFNRSFPDGSLADDQST